MCFCADGQIRTEVPAHGQRHKGAGILSTTTQLIKFKVLTFTERIDETYIMTRKLLAMLSHLTGRLWSAIKLVNEV